MSAIGDLVMRLIVDAKGFSTDIERQAKKAGDEASQSFAGKFKGGLKSAFSGAKGGILAGLGLGAGLSAFNIASQGVDKLTTALQGSIDAASNLNEATSKSEAVFKGSAGEIKEWAQTASTAFGQSERSALEAAGTFGNLIQAFGIGESKAAAMSKTLVELASDLASFNNTSVDEAIIALRAGLSGEAEPLKRYGVALNDARLKEEALRLGLIKTTKGVLPITIKTQAAYALILKDTALAQGDFARTADGWANKQKIIAARTEELGAKVGGVLLPKIIELGDAVLFLSDAFDALTDIVGEQMPAAQGPLEEFLDAATNGMRPDKVWEFAWAVHHAGEQIGYDLTHMKSDVERAAQEQETNWEDARGATQMAASGIVRETDKVGDSFQRLSRRTAKHFGQVVDDLIAKARKLNDEFFGPIEIRADIYQSRLEQNALEEQLRDAKTAAEKRVITDAIMAEIDRQHEGLVDLAERGELTAKEVKTFETNVKNSYEAMGRKVDKEVKAMIADLKQLNKWDGHHVNVSVNVVGDSMLGRNKSVRPGSGRAAGGPVSAGTPYWVGERGIPELFLPNVSGRIAAMPEIQEAIGRTSGGDTYVINQELHGLPMQVETPLDVARELRRATDLGVVPRRARPRRFRR